MLKMVVKRRGVASLKPMRGHGLTPAQHIHIIIMQKQKANDPITG